CEPDDDKDCCFEENRDFYWCDASTGFRQDRCVEFVTSTICSRCDTGYEDRSGDAPEACEDRCGDDNDDVCPSGCPAYEDKDCCFEQGDYYYWCDDVPLGKSLNSVCVQGADEEDRKLCPDYYYNDDGDRLRPASTSSDSDLDDEEDLNDDYKVMLELTFPNNELKDAVILVNGREIGVYTYDLEFDWDISDYVRSGVNSIQIKPDRTIDITSLDVRVKKK
ncbi:hypothetical protein GOV10_00645, partial [Candidatus Woesearchaeota archaeon]|nr:hypothetical protein [Candidatus Woesearchaeota archaeon]